MPAWILLLCLLLLSWTDLRAQTDLTLSWRVGDRWTYEQQDLWNRSIVGRTTLTVIGQQDGRFVLRTEGGAIPFDETVGADGRHERPRVGIIEAYAHTPVRFPLRIGEQWPLANQYQSQQGDIRKRDLTCTAKRQEKVQIPLGSFDTIAIECSGTWTSLQGYVARYELRAWYAPELRWIVRMEERNWRPAVGGSGLDLQAAHVLTRFEPGP